MKQEAKRPEEPLHGVSCRVENCRHHAAGDQCTAAKIDVRSQAALTKAETFCGTFTPTDPWLEG